MTMDERIEAAAKATWDLENPLERKAFHDTAPEVQAVYREEAERVLRGAFPELFDGTGWIAPWDATDAMHGAFHRACDENGQVLMPHGWRVLRDAHLKANVPPQG